MVMTDHELLEQLFRPARQMTIADDGFSDRVMEKIPNHCPRTLSRLWTIFCIVVAVLLFFVFDGWQLTAGSLLMLGKMLHTQHGLLMLAVSAGVIWLLAFCELFNRERSNSLSMFKF